MLPWVQLGTAIVPGGGGELRLMQRGTEFVIMAGRIPLMNSRMSGSEEALANLSWERVASRTAPGRGAWVCRTGTCFRKAVDRRAFARALRQDVRIESTLYTEELHG